MKKLLVCACIAILFVSGCKKKETINENIYTLMQEWYLWYDQLPNVNPDDYDNPYDLMDALRYPAYDKWSFVITEDEYHSYFEQGQMEGHGIGLKADENQHARISMVYKNTRAYEAGVRRGWTIISVNNQTATPDNVRDLIGDGGAGTVNTFTFLDNSGDTINLTLEKEVLNINAVLFDTVVTVNTHKIGYIAFQDFISSAVSELDAVFSDFNAAGINDIVVDMRYNGGGSNDVAQHFGSLLAGNIANGQTLVNLIHNNKKSSYNEATPIELLANSINLNRIFFIGTKNTASASEVVINGMEPFMNTYIIGENTHGKPVGMYVWLTDGYAVAPISFRLSNANNVGDYYDGLQADANVQDDLDHLLGDPDEACFSEAIYFIQNGSFSTTKKKTVRNSPLIINDPRNMGMFLKAL